MNFKKIGLAISLLFTAAMSVGACSGSSNKKVDYADGLKESTGLEIHHYSELDSEKMTHFADYCSAKDYYVLTSFGTCTDKMVVIPEYYDDGTHGKLPVSGVISGCRLGDGEDRTIVAHNSFEVCEGQSFRFAVRFLANGVRVIGGGTFGLLKDEYVVAPQSLEYIGQWSYYFAKGPKKIWLPKTVNKIGNAPFMDSTYEEIDFEGTEEDWNKITFESGDWATANTNAMTINYGVAYPGLSHPVEAWSE